MVKTQQKIWKIPYFNIIFAAGKAKKYSNIKKHKHNEQFKFFNVQQFCQRMPSGTGKGL